MAKFDLQIEKQSGEWKVKVFGTIDEDVDFGLYSLASAKSVHLQLAEVKSINSCGIREWIKWINTASSATITYTECPKIIVDQINMVQGFLPDRGRVISFFVPYYSEKSGNEKDILFRHGQEFMDSGELKMPSIVDSDGSEMEVDVVEAKYFKFLKK